MVLGISCARYEGNDSRRRAGESVYRAFGCPRHIHSDNAANFTGALIEEICRLLGIEKTKISPYHPEGNAKCERMMRTILSMLAKYLDGNHDNWDVHLPLLMLGYRANVHSSLGQSPYFMLFGRNPTMPATLQFQVPSTMTKTPTVTEYLEKLTKRLKLTHDISIQVTNSRHQRNKKLYEKKLTQHQFDVGDPVYLFKSVVPRGEYYKFVRPWKAAIVTANLSDLNYRVRLLGGRKSVVVHHNRLKPRPDGPMVPVPNSDLTFSPPETPATSAETAGSSADAPTGDTAGPAATVAEFVNSPPSLTAWLDPTDGDYVLPEASPAVTEHPDDRQVEVGEV